MSRIDTRKFALMIGLGVVLLLICIGVVFLIDVHFSLDPWSDRDVEVLWYFLVGSIFFPGALHRYRASRQTERKIFWYHRFDLILCLIGLVFGLVFVLSVVQKWVWSVSTSATGPSHSLTVSEGSLKALDSAMIIVNLCWIALLILCIYQAIKHNKQRKRLLLKYPEEFTHHDNHGPGSNVSNTSSYSLGRRLIGKCDGTNTQYYLTDAQGSVLTTFSNAATTTSVSGYQAYGPYGNTLASSGSMSTAKGFTGQYQDPTGLDYYNARYYDPVIGCFISADTVQGNAQGMDPYSYVNGNPETLTDPTGQTVSHCHELGDCGPDSYTTNVSGGDTGPGSVTQFGGGGCDSWCDGPLPRPKSYTPTPLPTGSGNPKKVASSSKSVACNPGGGASDACNAWAYKASNVRSKTLKEGLDSSGSIKTVGGAIIQGIADIILLNSVHDPLVWIQLIMDFGGLVLSALPRAAAWLQDNHPTWMGAYTTIMSSVSWIKRFIGVAEGFMGPIESGDVWAKFGFAGLMVAVSSSLGPVELAFKLLLVFAGPAIAGFMDAGANFLSASGNDDFLEENRQSNMNIVDWCAQYGNGACGAPPTH